MKLLLISDLHLLWDNPVARLDDAPVIQRQKLEFVLKYAKENDMVILQAGDFFDRPRSWMLLPVVMDLLKKYGVEIYCVYGQHDTYMYSLERQNTSLGILEKAGLVTILSDIPISFDEEEISLYGCSFGQEVPETQTEVDLNILVIHASIGNRALFPGHDYISAKSFLKKHEEFDLILCGDQHRFFCNDFMMEESSRFIMNSGPLLRREAIKANFEHRPGFFVYDINRIEEKLDWIEIPHRPADEVLSRSHIEDSQMINMMLEKFVESVSEEVEIEGIDLIENLWKFIKQNKIEQDVIDVIAEKVNKGRNDE